MSQKSPRRVVMDTLRTLCEEARNRRYTVKRGAVNWAVHDFDSHPYVIAILMDDQTFGREMNDADVALEFGARWGENAKPEIDDGLMDEFIDDAELVLQHLEHAMDAKTDDVVFKLDRQNIQEWHSEDHRAQGIIVHFKVGY